jgi:hypothetical protein
MALGSTQPLTEMSTKNISWDKGSRCVGLRTLPLSCADCLKIWSFNLLEPSGPVKGCNGVAFIVHYCIRHSRNDQGYALAQWLRHCGTNRKVAGSVLCNHVPPAMHNKGKSIPLQALTGPEGSSSLRLPDFKTIGTRKCLSLSAVSTGCLYSRKYSWCSFLLETDSTPGP